MSTTDPLREALAELVRLKDFKARLHQLNEMGHRTDYCDYDYHKREPLAWEAARAALSTPPAPEAGPSPVVNKFGDTLKPEWQKYIVRESEDETLHCDSCDCPAPTAIFEWGPGTGRTGQHLCEFCSTTMASRYTEYSHPDMYSRLQVEIWKASAAVFNMLARKEQP